MNTDLIPLGDVLDFFNGKAPTTADDDEYIVFGSNGPIGRSNSFNHENSIILGRVGAYCGSVEICSTKFWASDNTTVVKAKNGNDLHYLYYRLLSSPLRNYAGGAAQPLLTHTILRTIKVKVFTEQSIQVRIVDILSAYDDLIENNRRRIALLERAARELYREWFVRLRFFGHEHTKIVDGVPEGWERKTLGDIVKKIAKGQNITRNSSWDGSVPVVAGGLSPAYYHDTANVVAPVITVSASGANTGYVNIYHEGIWASDCSYISGTSTEYLYYLYLLLRSRQKEKFGFQKGAAQPHVYPKDLQRLLLLAPKEDIAKLFDDFVSRNFRQIGGFHRQNKQLGRARDLLLPRLISGVVAV